MAKVSHGPIERGLIIVHRWLGVVLALLMTLWSLSGIVMLYVPFPQLTEAERYAGLEPIDLGACCAAGAAAGLAGNDEITITMMAGRPVARVNDHRGPATLDLISGTWLDGITPQLAQSVAASHLEARGLAAPIAATTSIQNDQWTVYSRFHAHRPLYQVEFESDRGDTLYVSSATGEVVQDTHASERFWNWLGAVPHWLYYTAFRERQALWYQFIVYASLLGTLLALSGIYLGTKRTLAAGGRWTRYIGPMRWHHLTGLIFGVLTLTWIFSGLLSMNPWGWLESRGPGEDLARLEQSAPDTSEIEAALALAAARLDANTVSLVIAAGNPGPLTLTVDSDGHRRRHNASTFDPEPASAEELAKRLSQMRPDAAIRQLELLEHEDAYYFGHKADVRLPVYRAIVDGKETTRYYFDAETGELIGYVDRARKLYRWLHHGLHRLDFGSVLRSRPLWDIVILPLLLGVSILCIIGCWVSYRHLRYRQ